MDVDWATRGLTFLINNQIDASVILGEQILHGWRGYRGLEGGDLGSYVAGFSYALEILGVRVRPETLLAALERSSDI
jgi:hypothetical protein